MASMGLFEAFISLFFFLIFYHFIIKKHSGYVKKTLFQSYPWNWPVLGMLPGVLLRLSRIDDIIWVLEKNNLTFSFKGPWFARMDMLFTVDPANIQHMLSSNFSNYNKGPEFKELIDVFGGSILIADGELWKNLRMSSQAILSRQGFQNMSMSVTTSKLKDVLLPLFSCLSEDGTIVDLQDMFQRFMFDTTLVTTIGSDPQSLSTEMPELELAKALENAGEAIVFRHLNAGEAIVFRHFIPRFMWKFQTWMGLGQAKKLIDAGATFDRVCAKYILSKREEIQEIDHHHDHSNGESEDVLTYFMKLDTSKYELLKPSDDKFLRDTIVASILAMRDTTSTALTWFFWLISENPYVEAKIRQEINKNLPKAESSLERSWSAMDRKDYLNKLVYLHGALFETMRLYPPIPFECTSPIQSDVLPSGHRIEANFAIIIPIYLMGRMKSIWGEDALQFKPERWISETGKLRHEPSSKFFVFNSGPRICPGKNLAILVMKNVVVEILQNYDIKLVKGHKVKPKPRLVLQMKHGLRVTLTKRCSA
ncbi:PREDICTED: alkane hydroxylase MAH1-like [Brassica oleracea var. oleracea]|uniref:Cytochrome P450 n=1 Tax=Brassica oleracea var. oleracea TaxID=109376 RepID=A0A0D3BJH1_BRAOL|nr:PREDICTED: alkane hydroxylase MAH1-like [Brassica oleracea var. oleracea]